MNEIIITLLVSFNILIIYSKIKSFNSNLEKIFLLLLFALHFTTFILFYNFSINAQKDSFLFYQNAFLSNNISDFRFYGSQLMSLISYPFVKMGMTYFTLSLLFASISFLGFLNYFNFLTLKDNRRPYAFVLTFFLMLPSLHFWTAGLTKEALIFFFMSIMLTNLYRNKSITLVIVLSAICIFFIRPYMFFILILAFIVTYILNYKKTLRHKYIMLIVSTLVIAILSPALLKFLNFTEFSLDKIQYNFSSLVAYSKNFGGSSINLDDSNYIERLVVVLFRPLFFDAKTFYQYFISLENLLVLSVVIIFIKDTLFKRGTLNSFKSELFLIITFIATILFYGIYMYNLGLASRMRVMFIPYMFLFLFLVYYKRDQVKITKNKLVRITTVPMSLNKLLEGQLKFMNQYFQVIAISSDNKKLEEVGKKEGVETFHLEMTRKITPLKDIGAVWELYHFLKREKPLLVHTHTPKAGIVGMLASKLAGIPNRLHTVAGLPLLESKGIKRKVLNYVEKLTYVCATNIYPNSYGLQQIIIENKFTKKEKLKIIANGSSNGINLDYFNLSHTDSSVLIELRKNLDISNEDFVYIYVGRIVKDKGINELVEAFSLLNEKGKDVKLLLVGSYEEELDPIFESTKNEIQDNKNIIWVGYQEDVRPYLAISNILTFPSYREGFPNVVMQAGAMNLPCIVSNINGCNEIISEGFNGKIIPVKNVKTLFEAMNFFLENPEEYAKMKKNSRGLIEKKYKRKMICEALLNEYMGLVKLNNV